MPTGLPTPAHCMSRTLAALGICLGLGGLAVPAQAQSSAAEPTRHASRYDIAAGTLDQVLNRFAASAGVLLAIDGSLTEGKTSQGLSGTFSVREGLDRILAGSGLEAVAQPGGGYALRKAPAAVGAGVTDLPAITVTGANAGALPPPYAGGQVARGGRLGVLGNTDIMDAPFNISSYTAEQIQNQHAHSLVDVTQNDPSVRSVFAQNSGMDQLYIRGFLSANQDTAFDGQFGIAPSASGMLAVEMYERIEVLKGASSFLYGMAPSGSAGGVINAVPKRAGKEPVTELTLSGASDSMLGAHADLGRRFGRDQMFGIRVNAVKRKGESAWDHNKRDTTLGSVAFDIKTQRVRASVDAGYQEQDSKVLPSSIRLGPGVSVPEPPEPGKSYAQHWTFNDSRNQFVALRGEVDMAPSLQLYAAYGWNNLRSEIINSFPTVTNSETGDMTETAPFHSTTNTTRSSAEAGVRGWFSTGGIDHALTLSINTYRQKTGLARETLPAIASNLYDPILVERPPIADLPSKPPTTEKARFTSVALADTLSMFDDKLKLTLGARRQNVETEAFSAVTGARTAHYDESAVTPFVALVVKPWQRVSLYANYIEALSQGPTAPLGTVNVGEVFAPMRSKQYEIGAKVDFGTYALTASAFQITRPSAATDPRTNRFGVNGEQRNRGVEFNVFGEPAKGMRLLGGISYIEGVLSKTANGADDGNTAPGVPKIQMNLGGEWDVPALPGLVLSARAVHTSSQYYDAQNSRSIPSWTRFDLGARYTFQGPYPVTLRAAVHNVANKRYWASAVGTFGSELNAGAPRTFLLSASIPF